MNHGVQVRADDPETIMLDAVSLISRYTVPGSVARRVRDARYCATSVCRIGIGICEVRYDMCTT
jgi:hypothetical protein